MASTAPSLPLSFDDFFPGFLDEVRTVAASGDLDITEKARSSLRAAAENKSIPELLHILDMFSGRIANHTFQCFLVLFRVNPATYAALPPEDKNILHWILLLHDICKLVRRKLVFGSCSNREHPFMCAACTARILARLLPPASLSTVTTTTAATATNPATTAAASFGSNHGDKGRSTTGGEAQPKLPLAEEAEERVCMEQRAAVEAVCKAWEAATLPRGDELIHDNSQLPKLFAMLDHALSGQPAAALIVKAVALHQSLTVLPQYPAAAALTADMAKQILSPRLFAFLSLLVLADSSSYSLKRSILAQARDLVASVVGLARESGLHGHVRAVEEGLEACRIELLGGGGSGGGSGGCERGGKEWTESV